MQIRQEGLFFSVAVTVNCSGRARGDIKDKRWHKGRGAICANYHKNSSEGGLICDAGGGGRGCRVRRHQVQCEEVQVLSGAARGSRHTLLHS